MKPLCRARQQEGGCAIQTAYQNVEAAYESYKQNDDKQYALQYQWE